MFSVRALLPLLFVAVASAQQPASQVPQNPDWRKPYPAFRIVGNVYWVGTYDLATYLITTPQGHILVNTGFPETLPQIKEGVEKLGFKMSDVKILTATHGHGDHVAAMAALKKMTGAKLIVMEPDAELYESGGHADFRFGSTCAHFGSQSPCAARSSSVRSQIWSRSSSAPVCGSSIAAW